MPSHSLRPSLVWRLTTAELQKLFDALIKRGYELIGPTRQDEAIVYEPITSVDDLPRGWSDQQSPGTYRLKKRGDETLFSYAVGPHSWKRYLHLPQVRLWSAERTKSGVKLLNAVEAPPPRAFIGARACELNALKIQDKTLLEGEFQDPFYSAHRQSVFILAVDCGQPGGNCFCASLGTGPRCAEGYDLALTEVLTEGAHFFTVRSGSPRGEEIIKEIGASPAEAGDVKKADEIIAQAASSMGKSLNPEGLRDLFQRNLEVLYWDKIAARCLACGNCTMVCPTCFCTTVEDVTDLLGQKAERIRRWDSCFTADFSYIFGGCVRGSAMSRYRQWITHKLSNWPEQFGTLGCVGCGRCITWCPVGIDITEEVCALRDLELKRKGALNGCLQTNFSRTRVF